MRTTNADHESTIDPPAYTPSVSAAPTTLRRTIEDTRAMILANADMIRPAQNLKVNGPIEIVIGKTRSAAARRPSPSRSFVSTTSNVTIRIANPGPANVESRMGGELSATGRRESEGSRVREAGKHYAALVCRGASLVPMLVGAPQDSIEEALESGTASVSGGVEGRLRRILKTLDDASEYSRFDQPRRLFLVLHSLDSPALLTSRTRSHLQLLSSSPFVHILATVSHPNSHMLADYTVSYKRQLWIDCTTLLPHLDDCLITGAGVRLGGLPRAFDLRAGGGVGGLTGMGSMSGPDGGQIACAGGMTSAAEMHSTNSNAPLLGATAALHVLRSVTTKAKALFLKLASELQNQADASTDKTTFSSRSLPFSRLSHLAARNFIATSEPALRSLLVEFTSHGLVRVAKDDASGGEIVQLRMEGEAEVKTVVDGVKQL